MSSRLKTRPHSLIQLSNNVNGSKISSVSDNGSLSSASESNASSELFERQTRSGMAQGAGGSITDDSSPEDDDETKTLKKLHRRAKRKLSSLSERFQRAKNAYLDQELAEIEAEQKTIKSGSHPVYLEVLKELEVQRSTKIKSAQGHRRLHKGEIERLYDADVKTAWDQFRQRKAALRSTMIADVIKKIHQLDSELEMLNTKALDVPLLTRLPPRLPTRFPRTLITANLNTLSLREMEDDLLKIGLGSSRPRKKRRHRHRHHKHTDYAPNNDPNESFSDIESLDLPSPPITPHTPKAMFTTTPSPYSIGPAIHLRTSASGSPISKAALLYQATINSTPTRRHITMEDVLG